MAAPLQPELLEALDQSTQGLTEEATLTTDQRERIARRNVSRACRLIGISRQVFYETHRTTRFTALRG